MKTTNKFLAIILSVVAMLMPKSAWADGNFEIATLSNLTFHQSGCLKSFDVEVKAEQGFYTTAYGKIAVHTGTPTSSWNRPIGDGNSWPETIDDGGMVAISSSEFEWTDQAQYNLTVSIADGIISNSDNREYSIYLWSRMPDRGVYADYCFEQTLIVEDGTIRLSTDEPTPLIEYQQDGINYLLNPNRKTAELVKNISAVNKVVIPETLTKDNVVYTVTCIGEEAFCLCKNIYEVVIPNTITRLKDKAFNGCEGLTSVHIPNSVTSIGKMAFNCCFNLSSVNIPDQLTVLKSQVFSATAINSIVIPNSVIDIGGYAFLDCSYLSSVTFGTSVASLGVQAFAGCALETITIPDAVERLEYAALGWNPNLTTVHLGTSLKKIAGYAFNECPKLDTLYCCAESMPELEENAFISLDLGRLSLYVPESLVEEYKTTAPWSGFGKIFAPHPIYADCDETIGSVIGAKTYGIGETATLIAAAKEGISFNGWSDGNKENPRSFVVESTTPQSYTALFRKGGFTVNVSSNDSELGTAAAENVAYLEATPTATGEFKEWSDGNKDNPRKIALETLTEDKEITAVFEPGTMALMDGESYTSTTPYTYKKLNYARGYNNNVWSAWFVPFAVNATTLKDNGFDAAYIEGMHRYDRDDDGVIDETVMEVIKIKNGRLRAGTPYLVKAGETYAYPLSLTNVTVESANDIHDIETATATADYNFRGTYTGKTAEEVHAADNYYSLNAQGELVHRDGKILPLRWFMELIDKGGMYDAEPGSSPAAVIRIRVIGEEDTVTGLRTMYPESEQTVEKFDGMFDLSGRRLSAPQRGINIINGKKTLIK